MVTVNDAEELRFASTRSDVLQSDQRTFRMHVQGCGPRLVVR